MQNQGANAAGHTGQLYTGVRADTRSVKCRRDSDVLPRLGIKSIVMGHGCCDIYSPKALRAAMGSTFRLNISYVQLREFLTEKVMQGFDIIGTGLDKNYKTVDKLCESEKKVVIIGNEGSGISKEIQDICSIGMYIPMYGENESLNAAVAASIIMWENKRQNNERKPGTLDLA